MTRWLEEALQDRFPKAKASAYDTHRKPLSNWVKEQGLGSHFPQFAAWDIRVDITGLLLSSNGANLVLLEVKDKPLSLRHVGQILGYAMISKPKYAFLVSTLPPNPRLDKLLSLYKREDVLIFDHSLQKKVKIFIWDEEREAPNMSSLIPPTGSIFNMSA